MTRKRPDIQPCGERHQPWNHCLTCNPPPAENPDRLQGPEIGAECIYRSRSFPDGVRVIVTARSYVWGPGDPAYHGGSRRYDWKTIRILEPEKKPPFFGGNGLCVDDKDLEPVAPAAPCGALLAVPEWPGPIAPCIAPAGTVHSHGIDAARAAVAVRPARERCAGSGQLTLYGGDRRQALCPACHQTVATLPHPDGWPVLVEHRAREWEGMTEGMFA